MIARFTTDGSRFFVSKKLQIDTWVNFRNLPNSLDHFSRCKVKVNTGSSTLMWGYGGRFDAEEGQFGVFEKSTSANLFQISREKSCDYLLIIHKKKF